MLDPEIRDQSYQFFIEEAGELLESIETGLLSLSTEHSIAKVHEIMRAAHSIKGGAASVGLTDIQALAHRLEDFFKALYHKELVIDSELEELLLQGFDCLKNAIHQQMKTGSFNAEEIFSLAEPIFKKLSVRLADFLNSEEVYLPSSADLGNDLLSSIFEVDVPQELARLSNVLAHSETPPLRAEFNNDLKKELVSTLEVMSGLAELLNLPGLKDIATATQKGLELHPDDVLNIAHAALNNFQDAQEQIKHNYNIKINADLAAYTAVEHKQNKEILQVLSEDNFSDQAYQFFREEASELLQIIERELLTLKISKNKAKVHEIMRAAHSIKGGAASVGLEAIRTLAHSLEDFFKALYSDEVEVDTELESLLLAGFDCLKEPLTKQIETGFHNTQQALEIAKPIFEQLEQRLGDFFSRENLYIPSSEDLGIDMAVSIFEMDIPVELERLVLVIAKPSDYEVAAELRATAEVFAGFAELLNLPGFGKIATTTLKALELHPEQAVEITKVALQNFQAAREQVLAGHGHSESTQAEQKSGGSPTPELLAYVQENSQETITITQNSSLQGLEDEIRVAAYQYFTEEAVELLQLIEAGFSTLDREGKSKPLIHDMMRAAHSLKGGAASAGLETIRTLAYRLEKIFKAIYHDEVILDSELIDLIRAGFESLKIPLSAQIVAGGFDEQQALNSAEPIFAALETLLEDALKREEEFIPSSADLGVDVAGSLFEVDVLAELEKLAAVIPSYNHEQIVAQLQATTEILASFAELFNLPGLTKIATTTIKALELHPERVVEITEIALDNYRAAREAVLAGERTSGGSPTPELLALVGNSSPPLLSKSLEEVFGSAESIPMYDDGADFERLNNLLAENVDDFELPVPSLDEVFGTAKESEQLELPTSSLEEVFGSVEEALPLESPTSSLEEVFGNLEEALPLESPTSSLEEVFGSVEEALPLELPTSSLEEVFGSVEEPDQLPLIQTAAIKVETEPLQKTESEQQKSQEITAQIITENKLEEIVALVQKDFVNFPSIKEEEKYSNDPQYQDQAKVTPKVANLYDRSKTISSSPNQQASSSEVPKPEASPLSVRVDFNRLERLNNLVGELAINRNSLSLQNNQMQGSVKELVNRFSRFHLIANKLRELSDLMLVDASISGLPSSKTLTGVLGGKEQISSSDSEQPYKSDFDTLEMDRYGSLYSLLQSILEEMLQLEESVDDIVLFARGTNQSIEQQRQMLTTLRDELMWARMLPLGEVLNRFPRILRDLSTTHSKKVRLKLVGTGVLVDRVALEKLYDPLLHLLRNAFDHGIELPHIRKEKGKPEEGQIEIRAYHQGNQTIIEIKDDGSGLNLEKIRTTALRMSIVTPEQLAVMNSQHVAELIFEPGFSTAAQVTQLSGRGVGLDVVRSYLRAIKGTVTVSSIPGVGTTFTLRLPLTMTIAKLLVCLINANTLEGGVSAIALPSDSIEEIIIPEPFQLKKSGEQRFLYWQEQIIPIYPVCQLLDYRCRVPKTFSSKVLNAVQMPSDWGLPLLLLRRGQQIFALEVNRLVTEQELVIKPFGTPVAPPPYTYGCTILGDGTLIPVLNGIILLEQFLEPSRVITTANSAKSDLFNSEGEASSDQASLMSQTPTILVVDDSAALRRTLALTLQKAGYRVMQARDGREALDQLQQNSNVQLVICDVEMPNMNGFEFLGQRRRIKELTQIPVAMLTSRSSEKHRQLATHLGASAYFTKPYIEQQFLTTIENIVKQNSL